MTRVFLDVNVVVDALELRDGFSEPAVQLCQASEQRIFEGYLSAHSLTTLSYLMQQMRGIAGARRAVGEVLAMFEVVAVDRRLLTRALSIEAPDYEDAVSLAAAESAGCGLFVTRDARGFRHASIVVVDAVTAVDLLLGRPPGPVSERKARDATPPSPASRRKRR